jgi:hypothetical protein
MTAGLSESARPALAILSYFAEMKKSFLGNAHSVTALVDNSLIIRRFNQCALGLLAVRFLHFDVGNHLVGALRTALIE